MPNSKAVQLELDTHEKLKEICKKRKVRIKDFTAHMVDYFHRTGIDPEDEGNTNLKESIKELKKDNNRLIGFIKQQEKTKLNPILDQMAVGYRAYEKHADELKKIGVLEEQLGKVLRNQQRLKDVIEEPRHRAANKAIELFSDYLKEQEWGKAIGIGKYVKDPKELNDRYMEKFFGI